MAQIQMSELEDYSAVETFLTPISWISSNISAMKWWLWRNLAQLCVWAHLTPSANKISQIWKSKMAAVAILKNSKILISSQPIDRFDKIWHADVSRPCGSLQPIKFRGFKNSRWRRRPSWKFKKLQYLRNETTDFNEIWHTHASRPSATQ